MRCEIKSEYDEIRKAINALIANGYVRNFEKILVLSRELDIALNKMICICETHCVRHIYGEKSKP